jgi:hypothetical protein
VTPSPASQGSARVELAYLAGIIDGEGYIGLRHRTDTKSARHYSLVLRVANTDQRLIGWLQARWPGNTGCHRYRDQKCKPLHHWQLESRRAEAVLRIALPYLVIKREVADLALEMRATIVLGNNRISDAVLAERQRIYAAMRTLTKRGR